MKPYKKQETTIAKKEVLMAIDEIIQPDCDEYCSSETCYAARLKKRLLL